MKWHLNIILIILNLSIFGYSIYCLFLFGGLIVPFVVDGWTSIETIIKDDFFQDANYFAPNYVNYIFIISLLILHAFLIKNLLLARKSITKIYSGEIIYDNQSADFKSLGGGLIIFAKLKYTLLMITGVFFYNDITIFVDALPQFLLFYLLGKILLIISLIVSRGELLKKENDLTV